MLLFSFSPASIYGDELFDVDTYRVIIRCDGTVDYWVAGEIQTMCPLDLTYFPFDQQACYVELNSWTYAPNQVEPVNESDTPDMSLYHQNGQWTMEKTAVDSMTVFFLSANI